MLIYNKNVTFYLFLVIRMEQEWRQTTEGHWGRGCGQGSVPAPEKDPSAYQTGTPGTVRVSELCQ